MLKKVITYEDFNGDTRTETFWFHMSQSEILELNVSEYGGLENTINKMIETRDAKKLVELIKGLVLSAYGEKSADGRRFIKSEELRNEFSQTPAFSDLFIELAGSDTKLADFISGILPKNLQAQVNQAMKNNGQVNLEDNVVKLEDKDVEELPAE